MPRLHFVDVALACAWAVIAGACPCCPSCSPSACLCGDVAQPAPAVPAVEPATSRVQCKLDCRGSAITTLPLTPVGVSAKNTTLEECRGLCKGIVGCDAFVYGMGLCVGKRDVQLSACVPRDDVVTEIVSGMPVGSCTLTADPHMLVWDNPQGLIGHSMQLDAGDYWLMKSEGLHIQGRFGFGARSISEASLIGLAASGPLLRGHALAVQYVGPAMGRDGFRAFWDGEPILDGSFPAAFASPDGVVTAALGNLSLMELPEQARRSFADDDGLAPGFRLELSPGIQVHLRLGDETLSATIVLRRPVGDVDGLCGNFNCDRDDDRLELVASRGFGAPINYGSIFDGTPLQPPSQLQAFLSVVECPQTLRSLAESACHGVGPEARIRCMTTACASDVGNPDRTDQVELAAIDEKFALRFGFLGVDFGAALNSYVGYIVGATLLGLVLGGAVLGFFSRSGKHLPKPRQFLRVSTSDLTEALGDEGLPA